MYRGYKIVCNTAAGRRRYMQYLFPPVLACDLIDRYDIWVNTNDVCDIEFFKQIARKYPKVNLVWQPDGVVNGISSINAFYKSCVEDDAIYIKLDDDIVWLEPDFFEKMIAFRVDHPDYFLVSPLVINNALCTYILQETGKLKFRSYMRAQANHKVLWRKGCFAVELHEWFLNTQLPNGRYRELYCGERPIAMNRFSINAVLWFGKTMKEFSGIVPGDDEEFLSVIKPTRLGLANCFNGDTLTAHFAFYPQREVLDKANILERYGDYLHREWNNDPKMREIDRSIQTIMHEIQQRVIEIQQTPSPYKTVPTTAKKRWKMRYKRLVQLLRNAKDRIKNKKYIVGGSSYR